MLLFLVGLQYLFTFGAIHWGGDWIMVYPVRCLSFQSNNRFLQARKKRKARKEKKKEDCLWDIFFCLCDLESREQKRCKILLLALTLSSKPFFKLCIHKLLNVSVCLNSRVFFVVAEDKNRLFIAAELNRKTWFLRFGNPRKWGIYGRFDDKAMCLFFFHYDWFSTLYTFFSTLVGDKNLKIRLEQLV